SFNELLRNSAPVREYPHRSTPALWIVLKPTTTILLVRLRRGLAPRLVQTYVRTFECRSVDEIGASLADAKRAPADEASGNLIASANSQRGFRGWEFR